MKHGGGKSSSETTGPPNSGEPFIKKPEDIENMTMPDVKHSKPLQKSYETIQLLHKEVGGEVPIIGVVMSPFSLPVMQMGFERYLDLMLSGDPRFDKLMDINQAFAVEFANMQLESGATAICYFDPVSSPTIISPDMYRKTGFTYATNCISQIKGPVVTHFASGRGRAIVEDVIETGAAIISASGLEDLAEMKAACKGKITVAGNLNGIEMRRWTQDETVDIVKEVIAQGASGGGICAHRAPW